MPLDHSLTYKQNSFKFIPHKFRLKKILRIISKCNFQNDKMSYLDIGCSNGYITNIISESLKCSYTKGIDHNIENLNVAKRLHPHIEFKFINLNILLNSQKEKYNLITCFETLEHVGNLKNALLSILTFAHEERSLILISVPIEIGFWGIIKFLSKMLYGYKLDELSDDISTLFYFKDLILNKNISKYRNNRDGWGTHFGFDYRQVDEILINDNIPFKTINYFTTRFYIIDNSATYLVKD